MHLDSSSGPFRLPTCGLPVPPAPTPKPGFRSPPMLWRTLDPDAARRSVTRALVLASSTAANRKLSPEALAWLAQRGLAAGGIPLDEVPPMDDRVYPLPSVAGQELAA